MQGSIRQLRSYINGKHVSGCGALRALLDPSTGKAYDCFIVCVSTFAGLRRAEFHDVDMNQLLLAIQSSVSAQPLWAQRSPSSRSQILQNASRLINEEKKHFYDLESRDTGRVISEMEGDLVR